MWIFIEMHGVFSDNCLSLTQTSILPTKNSWLYIMTWSVLHQQTEGFGRKRFIISLVKKPMLRQSDLKINIPLSLFDSFNTFH
jgi:hypothetical protein